MQLPVQDLEAACVTTDLGQIWDRTGRILSFTAVLYPEPHI